MKFALVSGWILFVLEVGVAAMLLLRRSGGDATGNAIARDVGLILIPVLAVIGGLFIWGQRGGPRSAFWIGWTIIALPLIIAGVSVVSGGGKSMMRAITQRRASGFDDAKLTRLVRAVERSDVEAVRTLVAAGGIDWYATNAYDKTVLRVAVDKAIEYGSPDASLDVVRILLDAGAFPKDPARLDSLGAENTPAALVRAAFGNSNGGVRPVATLDLLLAAGGDANTAAEDGQPFHYSTYATTEALEVLGKHGHDFTTVDSTYESRRDASPAAWALMEGQWELALFLLEHGVSPDQNGDGGLSARSMIARLASSSATDPRYRRLKRLIDATPMGGFIQRERASADTVSQ